MPTSDAPLREGRDYTIENGFYVFTADYLRRRGYCCQQGCRHCPYGDRVPASDETSSPEAPSVAKD